MTAMVQPRPSSVTTAAADDARRPGGPAPRGVVLGLVTAVWLLPFLEPAGPGNVTLSDLGLLVSILTTLSWALRRQVRLGIPYAAGIGVLIVSGAVSGIVAGHAITALPLVQEVFLLAWAAAVANVTAGDPRARRIVLTSAVVSTTTWAGAMLAGLWLGIPSLSGVVEANGGRTAFRLGDPNLAGSYFVVGLALALATSTIRARWRLSMAAVLALAVLTTGSNGAIVSVGLVVLVGWLGELWRRSGIGLTTAATVLVILVVGVGAKQVGLHELQARAVEQVQVLRDSVGRSTDSAAEREQLVDEGITAYLEGNTIGVGPGLTKATLRARAAPYVKEAHNDYVATLVERGPAGIVGLLLVILTALVHVLRAAVRGARGPVPRPWVLVGLMVAVLLSGTYYEVLHFRHVWFVFGLVCALDPSWRPWTR